MTSRNSAPAPRRILIMDGDPRHSRIVADLLRASGYEVEIVTDSPAAVHKSFDFEPDLVLIETVMSRFDGTTACHALRELRPTLPIVILSTRRSPSDVLDAIGWGATRYITKPFDPQHLLGTIRALLGEVPPSDVPSQGTDSG